MIIKYITQGRCPNCYQGYIFKEPILLSLSLGQIHDRCLVCNYNLKKEPGYYWGAMYASYGLGLLEMLLTYLACRIMGSGTFDWVNLWAMCLVVLVLSLFNFKMARVIWLYIFP
jgi:uncharacterized protein (DUF983 family)